MSFFVLFALQTGALRLGRWWFEGAHYDTSWMSKYGYPCLIAAFEIGAYVLKDRGVAGLWGWMVGWQFHLYLGLSCALAGITFAVYALTTDMRIEWTDLYHHSVIFPTFVYIGLTMLPLIWVATWRERIAVVMLVAAWVIFGFADYNYGRFDQRSYLQETRPDLPLTSRFDRR